MSVAARTGGRRLTARRAARSVLTVAALAGIAVVAWLLFAPGDDQPTSAANDSVPLGAAAVERRDLVAREDVDGTLGFTDTTKAAAPAAGTITRLRDEGDTVTRGRSLMSIDAKATAWVLYGTIPMYRDLGPGVSDGRDVRQLERNLKALGYDPGTVDDDWTSATTDAVVDFQDDRDLTESGTIARSQVVVSDGPARVGKHNAEVGDPAPRRRAGDRADLDHAGDHREARRRAGRRGAQRRRREGDPDRRQRGRREGDRASAPSPPPARTAPRPRSSCAWR